MYNNIKMDKHDIHSETHTWAANRGQLLMCWSMLFWFVAVVLCLCEYRCSPIWNESEVGAPKFVLFFFPFSSEGSQTKKGLVSRDKTITTDEGLCVGPVRAPLPRGYFRKQWRRMIIAGNSRVRVRKWLKVFSLHWNSQEKAIIGAFAKKSSLATPSVAVNDKTKKKQKSIEGIYFSWGCQTARQPLAFSGIMHSVLTQWQKMQIHFNAVPS